MDGKARFWRILFNPPEYIWHYDSEQDYKNTKELSKGLKRAGLYRDREIEYVDSALKIYVWMRPKK